MKLENKLRLSVVIILDWYQLSHFSSQYTQCAIIVETKKNNMLLSYIYSYVKHNGIHLTNSWVLFKEVGTIRYILKHFE